MLPGTPLAANLSIGRAGHKTETIMEMSNLRDLFVDELRDLLHAEGQVLKALPKMAKVAKDPALQTALQEHTEQTRLQVQRLEQIFQKLGVLPKGKKCKGMQGILEQGRDTMDEDMDPEVMDAALIGEAQRVEHYEIAAYGTARAFARMLGDEESANLLQQTLDEEGQADKRLTQLAENRINAQAANKPASPS